MRVLCCSVTENGAAVARRLPFEHRAGRLVQTVRAEWSSWDAFVLIAATGVAVRAVAPLLADKGTDPAVVCVDDGGRFAIALTGGHEGGANSLALEVASILEAVPVVTTATEGRGLPALGNLPGYRAEGDVAGVTRRWLDGIPPEVQIDPDLGAWALPAALEEVKGHPVAPGSPLITVTDAAREPGPGEVLLRPATIVIGIGASTGPDLKGMSETVDRSLRSAGRSPLAVHAVATIDRRGDEPAVLAVADRLGAPRLSFPAEVLAEVAAERAVPNPSQTVMDAVGTPSVAEAAALAAAGPGSYLVSQKQVSLTGDSTVALARRDRPAGHLVVVGLGPGRPSAVTPEAAAAVRHAEVVVGYSGYLELASHLTNASQDVRPSPIGEETERCRDALETAAAGKRVALVCSGDPGVYAMASLVCELAAGAGDPPVTVVPGITAAQSAAALLGAPLGHDHASISLSDLLTPWEVIAKRLQAAAEGDFVVSLYNPRSQRRTFQLVQALAILARHRPASTPAAIVTAAGRPGEQVIRASISTLDPTGVGMLSVVVVGASGTRWIGDRMVTPRGYKSSG